MDIDEVMESKDFIDVYSEDQSPIFYLTWVNTIDSELPYNLGENPFNLKTWKYLKKNLVESL